MLVIKEQHKVRTNRQLQYELDDGETMPMVDPAMSNDDFLRVITKTLLKSNTPVPNAFLLGRLLNSRTFNSMLFKTLNVLLNYTNFTNLTNY